MFSLPSGSLRQTIAVGARQLTVLTVAGQLGLPVDSILRCSSSGLPAGLTCRVLFVS